MNASTVLLSLLLAALVGFGAERASLCTVKAVEEILTTGRAFMLASFVKTVLWVIGVTVLVSLWADAPLSQRHGYPITLASMTGGVLFGIGAVLNGGCALATVARLGSGQLGMLLTLVGFYVGADVQARLGLDFPGLSPEPNPASGAWADAWVWVLGLGSIAWMSLEALRLLRSSARGPWRTRVLASRYRLSTAAAVMGASNGILYARLGTWSYTHTIGQAAAAAPAYGLTGEPPIGILWLLFAALVLGVTVSTVLGRRFFLDCRPRRSWLGHFNGGVLMGVGAAMVPGGNDVLLLNAMPGASPHAAPAFAAMLVGIMATLVIFRAAGRPIPRIDCGGDLCRETDRTR